MLLEQELIFQHNIESKVCPVLRSRGAQLLPQRVQSRRHERSLWWEQQPYVLPQLSPELGRSVTL